MQHEKTYLTPEIGEMAHDYSATMPIALEVPKLNGNHAPEQTATIPEHQISIGWDLGDYPIGKQ